MGRFGPQRHGKKKTAKVSVHNNDFEDFMCKKELRWTGCAERVGQIGSVLQTVVDQGIKV